MSGITSTIHDSGRVYLFERNALPKNFIEAGMKLSFSGLNVAVAPGTCDIAGKYHELTEAANITLPQRRANLLYAVKSDLYDAPTFGYVSAAFPAADAGTVCRWIIDGSATIASTVGAITLNRFNSVAQVNGYASDYAAQGNGVDSYYRTISTAALPAGTAVKGVAMVFSPQQVTVLQVLCDAYSTGGSFYYTLVIDSDGFLKVTVAPTYYNTGFAMEVGKIYYVEWYFDGTNVIVYVNGAKVYSAAIAVNTVAQEIFFGRSNTSASYHSNAILYYAETRNALRTPAQIVANSNALLLPCRCDWPPPNTDITTSAQAISSSDYSGTSKAAAFNKDGISTAWNSGEFGAAINGVSYIGQLFGQTISISTATISQYTAVGNGITSVKLQITTNGGNTWTDVGVLALSASTNAPQTMSLPPVNCNGMRWLANAASGTGAVWGVYEVTFVTSAQPTTSSDIRAILPANTIALGFVRTDASKVIEADDSSYKYGRREGATGGNRRVFLGWKYFTANNSIYFDNPFGTPKVRRDYFFASDSNGRNECPVEKVWYNGTTYGLEELPAVNPDKMRVYPYNGVVKLNDSWQTSGYIGCYAEVME